MKSIKEEMDLLSELQDRAGKLQKNAEADIAEVSKRMKVLQKRVKDGETTGDKIKDFVLARYGFLNGEVEKIYRDLQDRVEKHVGEFILVFVAKERQAGCTGFGGRGYTVCDRYLYLTILKRESLVLSDPDYGVLFPTEIYYELQNRDGNACKLVRADLPKRQFLGGLPDMIFGDHSSFEIKIGDDEVNQWFNYHPEFLHVFKVVAEELGRPNEEFFKGYERILRRR